MSNTVDSKNSLPVVENKKSAKDLGRRIRDRRVAMKILSQQALAERMGKHFTTIARWELGRLPPYKTLVKLGQILKTNPEYFLGNTDDPLPISMGTSRDGGPVFIEVKIASQSTSVIESDQDGKDKRIRWDISGVYYVMATYLRDYNPENLYALKLEDKGLIRSTERNEYSVFDCGDYVIFSSDAHVGNGDIAVVHYNQRLFARIVTYHEKGNSPKTVVLEDVYKGNVAVNLNEKNDFCILGKVIYVVPQPQRPQPKIYF